MTLFVVSGAFLAGLVAAGGAALGLVLGMLGSWALLILISLIGTISVAVS